jgi:hypothetical protein
VGAPVGAEGLPGLDDGSIANGLGVGDHLEGGSDGRGGPRLGHEPGHLG